MADASIKIRGGAGNAVQIQSRAIDAVAPSDTEVLAWNATDAEWEPTASGGTSQWTDTGTVLHPTEPTVDNVVVGGTTTGNADIVLGVDGAAVFNEQAADVDFRVEANALAGGEATHAIFVQGSDGNVGIGTSSPGALFDVNDRVYITHDGVIKWGTAADYGSLTYDTGEAIVTSQTDQRLTLRSHGTSTDRLTIATSGNVGVGTTSPTELFEIEGDTTNLSIRNTAETEAGIILSDSAAPLTQFAKILFDSGSTESGLASGLSIMTAGGLGSPYTLTGSIDPTASTSVVGVGTLFTTELMVGDRITVSDETRVVATITDNTHLTVTVAFTDVANDTAVEMERRAMQIQSNGDIGMGVKPSTAGEKLVLNGAMALKVQASAPSATADYTKIYALAGGEAIDIQQATAKGWITLDGTGTVAITDSYNVSSLADDGTGSYTISWATDFADANYCCAGMCEDLSYGGTLSVWDDSSKAAGTLKIATHSKDTQTDADIAMVVAFGNQ